METQRAALHDKAARVAFQYYLRSGRVPQQVKDVLAATGSLAAVWKHDSNQPRVPAGHHGGGRWTDGGDWFDPLRPPGYVDLAPNDKPLGQVYVVEAVALLVAWEAVAAARIVAGLAAPLVARVARARRINQAAKALEQYLGGKPKPKDVRRNPAGDLFIIKGDKKIRFDINNSGKGNPHFHIEKGVRNGRKMDWSDAGDLHRYPFKGGK